MDADRVKNAASITAGFHQSGYQVVVVVSAQGHTTDQLIAGITEITKDPSDREMDAYLAAGEQLSAGLMTMTLAEMGYPAVSLTGWQAGLLTDGVHRNARILGLCSNRIRRELEAGNIVVVAGFQGVDEDGDITTLGRGGSDTTAVALAAFLEAEACRIYTDVDGVYDRDPRKDPKAVRYHQIDYDTMLEMARKGAQVLHDRSVEFAKQYGVRIVVLSSFRPGSGTVVEALDGFLPKVQTDIPKEE